MVVQKQISLQIRMQISGKVLDFVIQSSTEGVVSKYKV